MKQNYIGIHQPNFLPWLGYFSKIAKCTNFVFLDDVQFTKNSYINRVKIPINSKENWLTIPVKIESLNSSIIEVEPVNLDFHLKKIKKTIYFNYKKTEYFDSVFSWLDEVFSKMPTENIAIMNAFIIKKLAEKLMLNTTFHTYSKMQLKTYGDPTERLINICEILDGDVYLSGEGGFNYQDETLFSRNNLIIEKHSFEDWNDFKGMSILYTLFLNGFEITAKALKNKKNV